MPPHLGLSRNELQVRIDRGAEKTIIMFIGPKGAIRERSKLGKICGCPEGTEELFFNRGEEEFDRESDLDLTKLNCQ